MLLATKTPLDFKLSELEVKLINPYLDMYSIIIKCKNLGIQPPIDGLSVEDLDLVHTFYSQFEDTSSKVRK